MSGRQGTPAGELPRHRLQGADLFSPHRFPASTRQSWQRRVTRLGRQQPMMDEPLAHNCGSVGVQRPAGGRHARLLQQRHHAACSEGAGRQPWHRRADRGQQARWQSNNACRNSPLAGPAPHTSPRSHPGPTCCAEELLQDEQRSAGLRGQHPRRLCQVEVLPNHGAAGWGVGGRGPCRACVFRGPERCMPGRQARVRHCPGATLAAPWQHIHAR